MKYIICGDWQALGECGIRRYASNIYRELDNLFDSNHSPFSIEMIIPKNTKNIETYKNIKLIKKGYKFEADSYIHKTFNYIWRYILIPLNLRKKDILIDLAPLFSKRCNIVAIHDCILEHEAKENQKISNSTKRQIRNIKYIAKREDTVFITVSNTSKKEISNLYNINEDRIKVIGNAWQHILNIKSDKTILDKLNLKSKEYCFSIGYDKKYKNMNWINEVAKINTNEKFVISGKKDLIKNRAENVIMTNKRLNDEEIKALMENCKLFIHPSLYEGFGIPPLEAMAVGTRCLISNTSCLPEIYENSVFYLDPNNPKVIISDLTSKEIDDNEKILKKYSWKQSAKQLLDVLYSYCKEHSSGK